MMKCLAYFYGTSRSLTLLRTLQDHNSETRVLRIVLCASAPVQTSLAVRQAQRAANVATVDTLPACKPLTVAGGVFGTHKWSATFLEQGSTRGSPRRLVEGNAMRGTTYFIVGCSVERSPTAALQQSRHVMTK